ncbi:PREDICTED: probable UDP-N-acetylglucosamine--peptide N-acetylglucosaminyltransferase SPINDLY [Camelina sativa]|uniref:Probable UDP-N-acetylglucosamine--peptide N-acetylglucosaminyltransferase SPINDLY n=1 Tax=Camelina sativa TaxID=90675 RepID=A0ABM0VR79_CAMSA|nr:PREDICTED: probable UDP-N-acetylglucosamine--peptide N-acetylglucosaminyltransferase SPINDLY [Camelina sativa]
MDRPETIAVKHEPMSVDSPASSSAIERPPLARPPKLVVLADLNFNPPEADDIDSSIQIPTIPIARLNNEENYQEGGTLTCKEVEPGEVDAKKSSKVGKCRSRSKIEGSSDCGVDADGDQANQGVPASREEKISNLKMGLIHVARKMPKNAHAHFILGLMFQRLGQSQKAIPEYEKAEEILLGCEPEIARPELLLLVQIHHGQCILLDGFGDTDTFKELEGDELEEILSKLKDSIKLDVRQAAVWNTLGLMLLKAGCLMSAISVLSSLLALVPDNYDCLANLGVAYLQSGDMELAAKCFQDLVLKDHNHPAALINYAAELLCKHSSTVAGAGANGGTGASEDQKASMNVAKECLLAALRSDPMSAHTWVNLANSYYMMGDHRSSSKCLEKAAKLDPNCMATRFAVAVQRIKDAERSQDASDQLSWAGNEMASVIREGESVPIDPPIAWAGLAMVHKAQHEIAAAFVADRNELTEMEERAVYSLKQAITEDPEDAVRWHQLGLHSLCSQQYKVSQKYLKAAVSRSRECSYVWSNLGISLHLSDEHSEAEEVYKRALAVSTEDQAHTIFSNLGNLYRQKKQYEVSKAMFSKALELKPGYAPAYNNLGLVFVAERRWEEAKSCFEKSLEADSLLDAAQSNLLKATTMSRLCTCFSSSTVVRDS